MLTPPVEDLPAAPSSLDVVDAFDDFMQAFEAFKEVNDERLTQIEDRVSADVVTVEKMNRINRALDEYKSMVDGAVLSRKRPALGVAQPYASEHKAAFEAYVRRGDENGLRRIEAKALAVGTSSGADGGYTVPPEVDIAIGRRLAKISPIRAIATVRQMTSNEFKKPFTTTGAATGWVGETDTGVDRDETESPVLAELKFPAMELYAMPAATQTLLDDSAINIDEWIAAEIETVFAEQEGKAFVSGNGTNKPTGFLGYTAVADSSWAWGNIGFVLSGGSGGFAADDPTDNLYDLIYALKGGYRQNAHFVMNRSTQAEIRKLKDADGSYVWQPAHSPDAAASLLGFPVVEAEDMPSIEANSLSIAFGDFARGYLVVDRLGTRILRDPYTSKPYVLFYTTKRVAGGVQDFDAIKLMKFSAT
ncbi:MAG: phage major capsid protein [Pseudomonadota bacterium]